MNKNKQKWFCMEYVVGFCCNDSNIYGNVGTLGKVHGNSLEMTITPSWSHSIWISFRKSFKVTKGANEKNWNVIFVSMHTWFLLIGIGIFQIELLKMWIHKPCALSCAFLWNFNVKFDKNHLLQKLENCKKFEQIGKNSLRVADGCVWCQIYFHWFWKTMESKTWTLTL